MTCLVHRTRFWSASIGIAAMLAAPLGASLVSPAGAQSSDISPSTATSAASPAASGEITVAPVTPPKPPTAALIPAPALPAAPVVPVAPVVPGSAAPAVSATVAPATPAPAASTAPAVAPPVAAQLKPKRRIVRTPPRETALSTDPKPTLTPETFFATAKASERYAAIADAGGWPTLEGPVRPSTKGHAVTTLRLRLAIEGDLNPPGRVNGQVTAADSPSMFDTRWTPDLTAAVKRFQARHGLRETGLVEGATLKAMNVSARTRFTELASSAQRLAGRNFSFPDRYVVVNLPSASVEAVENGQVAHRYVAIVGDAEHPSPEVDSKVIAVNLNPTWTVPTSIIKNEIIPKMQRDPSYLAREKIRVLDNTGKVIDPSTIDWRSQRAVNYTLRQDSGKANSLGSIRLNMPNKFAVYMHDTPSKHLFGGDDRFLSHGCVRVQGVYDLAAWLLRDSLGAPDGVWSRAALEAKIADGQHEEVRLNQPVPVAWVYLTGWANGDGVVNFRDDVYGIDTVGASAEARVDPSLMPQR